MLVTTGIVELEERFTKVCYYLKHSKLISTVLNPSFGRGVRCHCKVFRLGIESGEITQPNTS